MKVKSGNEIPPAWKIMTIQEIADVNPRLNKTGIPEELKVSFVPMPAVGAGDGAIDIEQTRTFSDVKKGYTAFQEGDVLFAKITPCMENGKMAVVPKVINGYGFGSTEFHVLRPKPGIDARYLYHFISSKDFRGEAERYMTGAVGQKRVSATYLKEHVIPVAPLEQQRSIVAEIEKQFSRLDEAVTSLKRAKANLKRYKAAVLKAAVEGKLTEEWRKQHPDVEPASELLKRILAEAHPRESRAANRYQEAGEAENSFSILPKHWTWCRLGQIGDVIGGFTKNRKRETYEIQLPYLRVANVHANELRLNDVSKIGILKSEIEKALLRKNDLLIVEGNGSKEQIGRVAIWDGSIDTCVHQNHIIKVRLYYEEMAEYVLWWLLSSPGRRFVDKVASSTSGLYTLNISKVSNLPVPLPPIAEQIQIATKLEIYSSLLTAMQESNTNTKLRSDRFRQAILSSVFKGS
ncbi:MAG: restriction endonuclease subunit S [Thiobacillus sp.]